MRELQGHADEPLRDPAAYYNLAQRIPFLEDLAPTPPHELATPRAPMRQPSSLEAPDPWRSKAVPGELPVNRLRAIRRASNLASAQSGK